MPVPTTPIDIKGVPARAGAYARLEALLISGELAPGSRLTDHDLTEITGTSRAPLREALNRLAAVGLVTVSPRRFTEVTRLDDPRARDSADLLGAVVGQAMEEGLTRLTPAGRERLAQLRTTALASEESLRAGLRAATVLRDLHGPFLQAARNTEYQRLAETLGPYVERALAMSSDRFDAALPDLRRVVDASLTGDLDSAQGAWAAVRRIADDAFVTTAAIGRDAEARPSVPLLREKAVETIQHAIIDGTLVPGEQVRESDLMTWLGVSRTPVREALAVLARRGLVVLHHHRAASIATVDDEGFRDGMRAIGVVRRVRLQRAMDEHPVELARDFEAALEVLDALDATPGSGTVLDSTVRLSAAIERASESAVVREIDDLLTARLRWYAVRSSAISSERGRAMIREYATAVIEGRKADADVAVWRLYAEVLAASPAAG
ncbi:GntR family transcriptional regulator [Cellulomonas sp. P5_C5]